MENHQNALKITKKHVFSRFYGSHPQFFGIWSKVTEGWVEVGGPRAQKWVLWVTWASPLPSPGRPGLGLGAWARAVAPEAVVPHPSSRLCVFCLTSVYVYINACERARSPSAYNAHLSALIALLHDYIACQRLR